MNPSELASVMERVVAAGHRYNAVATVTGERAERLVAGAGGPEGSAFAGPLAGVPLAVKDIVDVAGYRTGVGSRVEVGPDPATRTAPIVEALEGLGAVTVAKANCQEFSYNIVGGESANGRSINPRGEDLVTGGSSNGSAVLVAAGAVPLAVGTDTAGSVRAPAACCGVVGFKPTHGALPAAGVFPLAPSCDTVGLLGADVEIVARAFTGLVGGARAGADADEVAVEPRVDASVLAAVEGVSMEAWMDDDERARAWQDVFAKAAELYEPIRRHESYLVTRELLSKQRERMLPRVAERLARGADIGQDAYDAACAEAADLRVRALALLDGEGSAGADFLLTPAFTCQVPTWFEAAADPDISARMIAYTVPFNILGWPAIMVPLRDAAGGLLTDGRGGPMSVQIAARPGWDLQLLEFAAGL
ncbi:amidase [Brevibacterium sp. 91QC2O2]|uniref:amidase n=1 Tax=Brevibacterium sp. 91QC2O2 TaxID=2968458 RepID=UPI00211D04A8|nr:amidase [Brevibacterium sp. 91QC2O2]MCQ9367159.1 amidase [Brevibacterium sp. 91QC2O2]